MLGNKIQKIRNEAHPKTAICAHVVGKKKEFAKKGGTRRTVRGEELDQKTEKDSNKTVKRQPKHIDKQRERQKRIDVALERWASGRRDGERWASPLGGQGEAMDGKPTSSCTR